MTPTATILLATGFEESEAVLTIDILRRAKIAVTIAGIDEQVVTSAHAIKMATECILTENFPTTDCLILPGGELGTINLGKSDLVTSAIHRQIASDKWVAAICAAPSILTQMGLLTTKRSTCFPKMRAAVPNFHDTPVVIDHPFITSQGVGTTILFACAIVEHLIDAKTADAIATEILAPR